MLLTSISHLQNASDDEVAEVLKNSQVIPKIESYLEDWNLQEEGRSLFCFSASDIGSSNAHSLCGQYPMGCGRLLYYRYVGEQPDNKFPPRILRIFDTGTAIHEQLQAYLNRIAKDLDTEVFADEVNVNPENSEIADEYEINSTTDGLYTITMPELKFRFGLEIKSINENGFKTVLGGPKREHVVQSICYMACLDVPVFNILYYSKNDSMMTEFPFVFDQKIWQAIADKINYVRIAAVNEEPPPRESGYHCKTCRYAHICDPPKPMSRKKLAAAGRASFSLRR